ncbi:MAG: Phosphoglucosamine mutase [Turneriella sp.]|nr:Phosphoglucosamine mutase [Turneriella sp.]
MELTSKTLKFSISGLRGVYPDDISPDKWVEYVRAFCETLPKGPVAVARDARATGQALLQITSGVLQLLGRDVHDLGLVPTPTIKAYVNAKKLAGGVMVSASHNPAEYNALKFIGKNGFFFDKKANAAFTQALNAKKKWGTIKNQGKRIDAHSLAMEIHCKDILRVVQKPKRRLKVVIDPVGSCGGEIATLLLKKLGCTFEAIHLEETPVFPRPPEPTAGALKKLADAVKKYRADIGFAFDPDADRLSLVDENGRAIGEEYTLPLAVLSSAKEGGTVVANLSTSMLTQSAAEIKKCKFVRSEVGEANVVAEMLKRKSSIGGEGNGGVIDARLYSFGRDALSGIAHIVSLVASAKEPLSYWVNLLPRFTMVKQVYKDVTKEGMEKAVERAKGIMANTRIDTRDGIHLSGNIEGMPAWIHLRTSNTEPVVRLIAEAVSKETLKKLLDAAQL